MKSKFLNADTSYLLTMVLGGIIMLIVGGLRDGELREDWPDPTFLIVYIALCVAGLFVFWAKICPHCMAHGSKLCPSGHGVVSARWFKPPAKRDFRRAFNSYIWVVALQWFVPLAVGLWQFAQCFCPVLGLFLAAFAVFGFVLVPLVSGERGCDHCPQKKDCPWMGKRK